MASKALRNIKGLTGPEGELLKVALLQQKAALVTHADAGTSVTLFGADKGVVLMGILAVVSEKFDVATGGIAIGDGTTAALYGRFEGCLRETGSYMRWLGVPLSANGSIVATVTCTSATTGEVTFYALYVTNNDFIGGSVG